MGGPDKLLSGRAKRAGSERVMNVVAPTRATYPYFTLFWTTPPRSSGILGGNMRALSLLLALLQLTSLCVSAQGTPRLHSSRRRADQARQHRHRRTHREDQGAEGENSPGWKNSAKPPTSPAARGSSATDYKTKEVAGEEGPEGPSPARWLRHLFPRHSHGRARTRNGANIITGPAAARSAASPMNFPLPPTMSPTKAPGRLSTRRSSPSRWRRSDTTFARLNSEYYLKKNGVALDTASIIAAADDSDPVIAWNAFTALRFRELSPEQLAQFRQGFKDGKIHVRCQFRPLHHRRHQGERPRPVAHLPQRPRCRQPQERAGRDGHISPKAPDL